MAKATQLTFTLQELTELLLKAEDVHEGKWVLGFEFGFSASMSGQSPATAVPTAFVQVNKAILNRAPDETNEHMPVAIDASLVNPATSASEG
jgi:hypothetical protein